MNIRLRVFNFCIKEFIFLIFSGIVILYIVNQIAGFISLKNITYSGTEAQKEGFNSAFKLGLALANGEEVEQEKGTTLKTTHIKATVTATEAAKQHIKTGITSRLGPLGFIVDLITAVDFRSYSVTFVILIGVGIVRFRCGNY